MAAKKAYQHLFKRVKGYLDNSENNLEYKNEFIMDTYKDLTGEIDFCITSEPTSLEIGIARKGNSVIFYPFF